MKLFSATMMSTVLLGTAAIADGHATGDAASGENVYKKCKSCHVIADNDGSVIQKGGKTGPNLYGIMGRAAGSVEDFKYGDSIVAAGEAGLEWNEEAFVEYLADPKKYLAAYLDDKKAKSRMSFKLKKADDAADVWAYLVSVGPEVDVDAEEATTESN